MLRLLRVGELSSPCASSRKQWFLNSYALIRPQDSVGRQQLWQQWCAAHLGPVGRTSRAHCASGLAFFCFSFASSCIFSNSMRLPEMVALERGRSGSSPAMLRQSRT